MNTFERTYTIGATGQTVRVRVEINEDDRMERAVRGLAQKALASRTRKCSSALGGMIRVCIVDGKPEPVPQSGVGRHTGKATTNRTAGELT